MLRMPVLLLLATLAVAVSAPRDAEAIGPVVLPLDQFAVIAPDTGSMKPRVLMGFILPNALSDVEIDEAHLRFSAAVDVPPYVRTGEALLRCSAVSEPWDAATVGWDFPWDSPGAVLDIARLRNTMVGRAEHAAVRINVADIVQEWVDNPSCNFGLAVACADRDFSELLVTLPSRGIRDDWPRIEILYSLRHR